MEQHPPKRVLMFPLECSFDNPVGTPSLSLIRRISRYSFERKNFFLFGKVYFLIVSRHALSWVKIALVSAGK
jgi:hypothetical protein